VFKVRVKGEVDIFLPGGNGLCTVVWVAMICWCVFVILIYRLWWRRGNRLGVAISHSWHENVLVQWFCRCLNHSSFIYGGSPIMILVGYNRPAV
jgi:hypothetical protein